MSGYLRRLAAGVNSRSSAIHPIAGSVFAGPENEAPAVITEEQVVAPRTAAPMNEQPRGTQIDTEQPRLSEESRLLVTEVKSSPPRLLSERIEMVRPREPIPAPRREGDKSDIPPRAPGTRDNPSVQTAEMSQPVHRPADHIPAPRAQHTPAIITRPVEPPRAVLTLPPSRNAGRSASQRTTSSGPDEIQIHIGRIEVTAVPPPATKPQAKQVRKTPSLSEYLQRGRRS
jgi:hypothetical protein